MPREFGHPAHIAVYKNGFLRIRTIEAKNNSNPEDPHDTKCADDQERLCVGDKQPRVRRKDCEEVDDSVEAEDVLPRERDTIDAQKIFDGKEDRKGPLKDIEDTSILCAQ